MKARKTFPISSERESVPRAGKGWVPSREYGRWLPMEPRWVQKESGEESHCLSPFSCVPVTAENSQQVKQ